MCEETGVNVCERGFGVVRVLQLALWKMGARGARENWQCAHIRSEDLRPRSPGCGGVRAGAEWTPAWGTEAETQ